MGIKQSLKQFAYFFLMKLPGKSGNAKAMMNDKQIKSLEPFYSLQATRNNGKGLAFVSLRGKKVLIVNTASECGYTPQYEELEKLYEENKNNLVILGFPANDFGEQEKGSDDDIAKFCKINYGVTFPLMKKSTVIKNDNQNDVFKWLTTSKKNGWNDQPPTWNFCKYLINEDGMLMGVFASAISPLSKEITDAVNIKL